MNSLDSTVFRLSIAGASCIFAMYPHFRCNLHKWPSANYCSEFRRNNSPRILECSSSRSEMANKRRNIVDDARSFLRYFRPLLEIQIIAIYAVCNFQRDPSRATHSSCRRAASLIIFIIKQNAGNLTGNERLYTRARSPNGINSRSEPRTYNSRRRCASQNRDRAIRNNGSFNVKENENARSNIFIRNLSVIRQLS